MEVQTVERFGYVRRFSYTGEAWHIIDYPPAAGHWGIDAPTLCGYPAPAVTAKERSWATVCAGAPWMKVCSRCERVRRRYEAAG